MLHTENQTEQETESEYIMLFRGTQWDKGLSPEEIQTTMTQWMAWFNEMVEKGKFKAGQPLKNEGVIISGKDGLTISDGPFAESKEAIGGYCLLKVADLEEAMEIARSNPALKYGMTIELRPVAAMCPVEKRLNELAAAAR